MRKINETFKSIQDLSLMGLCSNNDNVHLSLNSLFVSVPDLELLRKLIRDKIDQSHSTLHRSILVKDPLLIQPSLNKRDSKYQSKKQEVLAKVVA